MKELPVQRCLNEDTRKQGVWLVNQNGTVEIFSLHITHNDEVIITDNKDYSKIYCIMSLEYYQLIERQDLN